MNTALSLAVAALTALVLVVQVRLLRRTLEASNHQDIVQKVIGLRGDLVAEEKLHGLFDGNPELDAAVKNGITMQEAFWILSYLTVWENFFHTREKGIMNDARWEAYVETMKVVFKTPKIRTFWETYKTHGTYQKDWVSFVDVISDGIATPTDPRLPWYHRLVGG